MAQLAERPYNVEQFRNDSLNEGIRNALYQLVHEYNGQTYIGDAVSECADYNVPIYDGAVLEAAPYLEEYADQLVAEGIYTVDKNFSVVHLFRMAFYMAVEEAIYENMSTVIFNIMMRYIRRELDDKIEVITSLTCDDIDAIVTELIRRQDSFDTMSRYIELEDSACEVLEMFITE